MFWNRDQEYKLLFFFQKIVLYYCNFTSLFLKIVNMKNYQYNEN